ncbi:MAG: NAD(P) transhydrogenase subunit alpha [Candidatus Neomarinimicrobiota bacterium]|nr:MAG: NAD(P) transhydrogenase subunit alpha [Candidatus Neomarinimicrobiota bacterium]
MKISIPKETIHDETRVAATPQSVKELIKAGYEVNIETGAGTSSFISDDNFKKAGANIVNTTNELFKDSDIIIKVAAPTSDEIELMPKDSILVSFFQPTIELEKVKSISNKNITGLSMHLVPRTTLAQKMDALSSQANIAGYKAVLMGSSHMNVYMPLLMTAAGTIRPAKVLILGAGVAGLQAIATAKRLGAQVEAFDVRPEVKEQVESLGAKFVEVSSESDDGVGEGGYAKETSDEYKQKQQELIKEHISKADMVVTTALIPGRKAPILIGKDVVELMKPGSVIMDLAAENGGNCEVTEKDKIITHNEVIIDGTSNIPATMPVHASELYAKNISALVVYMTKENNLNFDMDDEIISGSTFTHQGIITHEPTRNLLEES